MEVTTEHALLDAGLQPYRERLGKDYNAYRGHLLRMHNFLGVLLQRELAAAEGKTLSEKLAVALLVHDLGIWTAGTFDYLPPSVELLRAELEGRGRSEWFEETEAMVVFHHKLRPYRGKHARTVEAFRKADLIDLSLGTIRAGLPRDYVRAVRAAIPNAGFHKRLVQLTLSNLARRPWKPAPMFRL